MSRVLSQSGLQRDEIVFYFDTGSNSAIPSKLVTQFVDTVSSVILAQPDMPSDAVVEIVSIEIGSLLIKLRVWCGEPENWWKVVSTLGLIFVPLLKGTDNPVAESAAPIIVIGNGNEIHVGTQARFDVVQRGEMPAIREDTGGGFFSPTPRLFEAGSYDAGSFAEAEQHQPRPIGPMRWAPQNPEEVELMEKSDKAEGAKSELDDDMVLQIDVLGNSEPKSKQGPTASMDFDHAIGFFTIRNEDGQLYFVNQRRYYPVIANGSTAELPKHQLMRILFRPTKSPPVNPHPHYRYMQVESGWMMQ